MFTFAAWLAVTHARSLTGKIVLGVILGLILAAGVRALRIGGHHGDVIGLAGASAAIYWNAGLTLGAPRRDRYAVGLGPTWVSSHSCRDLARAKNSTTRSFACGVPSHVPAGHSRQAMRPFIRSRSIRG